MRDKDYTTKSSARKLMEELEAFWNEKGIYPSFWLEYHQSPENNKGCWCVKSSLNGTEQI